MPYREIPCVGQGCESFVRNRPGASGLCRQCIIKQNAPPAVETVSIADQIVADRLKVTAKIDQSALQTKYKEALKTIERLETERSVGSLFPPPQPCVIEPYYGQGTNEATVVVLASDWHSEEEVNPRRISRLNTFNLEIAEERIKRFFQASVRLVRMLQQDVKIEHMVMGLLGDFISGDIHEEVSEVCLLPPMEAIVFVQDLTAGGIEHMLEHTKLTFRFQCHVGNHGRTSKTNRFATENGHNLEYLLYKHLATHFRNEPRVQFEIADGPHSYVTIYGKTIRFQHGHMVKYGGGVGGITIPVNKAIGEWNKGIRADLDCFGHFHQAVDGNNFICNGPLIGYNSFALSIKAPYDVPTQTLFLMDKKRGRTCRWPIYFKR